jgi:hypothetical protein
MTSTNTIPCHSHRNTAKDAQAAPAPSSLPSQHCSPSNEDKQGGKATIAPLAAVHAANATAVAAANSCRKLACPLAPTADVLAPLSSTFPASLAAFPCADIMTTAALALTAKFARPEAVAADVSAATAEAYSTLGATNADDAKMGVLTVKALSVTANLATAEAAAADVPVATAVAASAVAVDFAVVAVAVPVVVSVGKEGVSFA